MQYRAPAHRQETWPRRFLPRHRGCLGVVEHRVFRSLLGRYETNQPQPWRRRWVPRRAVDRSRYRHGGDRSTPPTAAQRSGERPQHEPNVAVRRGLFVSLTGVAKNSPVVVSGRMKY
jgi:hypothetical protein